MDFFHDGIFCPLYRVSRSNEAYLSLEVLATSGRNIDFAAGIRLHVFDSLAT